MEEFKSDAALIDFERVQLCEHGFQHYNSNGNNKCSCIRHPPAPTSETFTTFACVLDVVAQAGPGLDWSEPVEPGEQNVEGDQELNTALVGEFLSELEHYLKVLVSRAEVGYNQWALHAPTMRLYSRDWLFKFAGSGAMGSIGGVFVSTSILLNSARFEQVVPLIDVMGFDTEGLLKLPEGLSSLPCANCGQTEGITECTDCLFRACCDCLVHPTRGTCCCLYSNFGSGYSASSVSTSAA